MKDHILLVSRNHFIGKKPTNRSESIINMLTRAQQVRMICKPVPHWISASPQQWRLWFNSGYLLLLSIIVLVWLVAMFGIRLNLCCTRLLPEFGSIIVTLDVKVLLYEERHSTPPKLNWLRCRFSKKSQMLLSQASQVIKQSEIVAAVLKNIYLKRRCNFYYRQ